MTHERWLMVFTVLTVLALGACASFFREDAARDEAMSAQSLWSLEAESLGGEKVPLAQYEGQVVLVVNVASECGFTPQYGELQTLQDKYAARGLVVLGFPSNEFGGQEPGSPAEIQQFCQENYGVSFPMFAKVQTGVGPEQSPVYAMLGGATGTLPGWNFGKYLVSRDGKRARFFDSLTEPLSDELVAAVEEELGRN
jgi:glutathione peroxidase